MKAALHLIRASRADFIAHREPDSVEGWLELAVGGPLMALVLFALAAM